MKALLLPPFVCFFLCTTSLQAQFTSDDLAERQQRQTNRSPLIQRTNTNIGQARTSIPAPAASGDNLCAAGVANLTATASSGGALNWYNVATGGTALATGTAYSPMVSSTTNYWVEEVVGGGSAQNLIAPYNSNNGQRGCMFDLQATNTVTITHFDANLYAGTTANYEIYYRAGTHVGFENNAAAWTLLGTASSVTSAGNNVPTPLPINFSVTIPAGQTYSFYITNDFGAGTSYTDGTAVGNFLASDANLTIYEGVGKSYPFGLTFSVRNFNGTIHYSTGAGSCTSPRTLVTANVKAPIYASSASTTISNASCTVNEAGVDWTYYYNAANPNELLFAIAHDPHNLGNNAFSATVEVTTNANSTSTGYYSQTNVGQQLARFVMGRYWNVNLNSGAVIDPVWLRFYYQNAEKTAMTTAASTWAGSNGAIQSPMYFFKTNGVAFDPATSLHASGVYNSLELSTFIDNQTSSNGVNYVEIQGVNSFSGGGLIMGAVPVGGATTGTAILLQLEVLHFKAVQQEAAIALSWTSQEALNVSHFVVERSPNGIDFSALQTVDSKNKEGIFAYHQMDPQPLKGANYYRLKIVASDGSFTYSSICVVVMDHQEDFFVKILSNPFKKNLSLSISTAVDQQARLLVYNVLGQLVYQNKPFLDAGSTHLHIKEAFYWQAGSYTILIEGKTFTKQLQVVKN